MSELEVVEVQKLELPQDWLGYCLPCITEQKDAVVKKATNPEIQIPMVEAAITLCPSWQTQVIGTQLMMACVAVPACYKHIGVTEPTAQQRAAASGLAIG